MRQLTIALVLLAAPLISAAQAEPDGLQLTSATIADLNDAFDAGALTAEKLVQLCIARIEAYDDAGPKLNALLLLNPKALERARELDRERSTQGPRSPLHGIPVVLKDNFDTADMPTTAGSFLLAGSLPPDDAFLVRKLRDAGAIILAKLNMSEFASGGAISSLGGGTLNPHDLSRTPSGSSGGTGAAIAAAYAPVGLGTDTGGSVRGPSTANGIVGLKTTHGLLSRDGIIPLALAFDTAGPMARSVYDVAAALSVMTGVDPADESTLKSKGRYETNYTRHLDRGALGGARIGVLRDFMGQDGEVDWIVEASLQAMRDLGASIIDIRLPRWLLDSKGDFYWTIRHREFRAQIAEYLRTIGPGYPKTLAELIEGSMKRTSPVNGTGPNPSRWSLFRREDRSGDLTDQEYLAVRDYGLPFVRRVMEGVFEADNLDALLYPTSSRRPGRIDADPRSGSPGVSRSGVNLANLTGFPDLVVPAGFTAGGLPVGISLIGRAFNEARILALGYAFEQAVQARRLPVHTPPLAGENILY
jgi:amidase